MPISGNTLTQSGPEGTTAYTYDLKNRLIGVTTPNDIMAYTYDTDGIRVGRTVNGVTTHDLVDKNRPYAQVLEERTSQGHLLANYTYGHDLLSQKRGTETHYFHYDRLGSTRGLTDENQTVTDVYNYEAFGNPLQIAGTTPNHYRFTGEQHDSPTGLVYLRARYYDPNSGRFLTQDTWQGQRGRPITLHKYLYANANPIVFIDPTGRLSLASLNIGVHNILTTLTRPFFSLRRNYIMNRMKSKKFDVFLGVGAAIGFPIHIFVYVEKKLFNRWWRFDSGIKKIQDQKNKISFLKELQACKIAQKSVGKNTYPGVLTKTYTTRKDLQTKRMANFLPAELSPRLFQFTLMQYIGWQRVVFSPFRNEPYSLRKGGFNCFTFTGEALVYASIISTIPLYP